MVIKKFQAGGPMPAEDPAMAQGAPAEAQASPEEQLAQLAQQLVEMLMQQIGDPQAVAAVLQMALDMVAQAGAPEGAAPQGEPVYRRGGQMVRRCGGKVKKAAKK